MKKIIVLFFFAAALISCRKTYRCSCTTIVNDPGTTHSYSSGDAAFSRKLTKDQAQSACDHEEKDLDTLYVNVNNASQSPGNTITSETQCTIQ